MLNRVIDASVRGRWLVLLLVLLLAGFGVRELMRLPVDAVPDITNRQVQINTIAPALGPEEVERQVTFPLETALAGLPGLTETRSLSRHGFSQITAVFTDATDIYFARNLVNERLQSARQELPEGLSPTTGPVVTGLGEVYIWTVEFTPEITKDGAIYVTPEGERLTTALDKATYLRTVQDWIIAPQLRSVKGVAGVDVLGGYVKSTAFIRTPRSWRPMASDWCSWSKRLNTPTASQAQAMSAAQARPMSSAPMHGSATWKNSRRRLCSRAMARSCVLWILPWSKPGVRHGLARPAPMAGKS